MDFITHVTTASQISQVPPDPSPLWQPVSAGVLVSPWSIIYRSFLRATALEQWVSGPKSDHTVHSPEFSSWEAKGQEGMSQGWIPGGIFSVPSLGLPNQIFAVEVSKCWVGFLVCWIKNHGVFGDKVDPGVARPWWNWGHSWVATSSRLMV